MPIVIRPGACSATPASTRVTIQPPVLWVLLAGARCRMS